MLSGVIGARAFVHTKTHSTKLEFKALEGRVVGYSNSSKNYSVLNSATPQIMKNRNVISIKMPSRLLLPRSNESWMQPCRH